MFAAVRRPSSLLFLVSLARVASSYLFCPLACPPVVCRRRSGREREGCTRTAAHPSFGRFHSMRGAVLLSMFQRVVRVVASCSLIVVIAVGVAGVVLVLVLYCRPCALSSFSRNRPHVVEADLSLPSTEYDHFLCRKAVRVRDPAGGTAAASRSRGSGRIAPTATRTALDDIAALRDWFRDRFLPAKNDGTAQGATQAVPPHSSTAHDHHTLEPPSSPASELMGTVVLAERGQCLFEDKAALAEKAGALALIVQNNEVRPAVVTGVVVVALTLVPCALLLSVLP